MADDASQTTPNSILDHKKLFSGPSSPIHTETSVIEKSIETTTRKSSDHESLSGDKSSVLNAGFDPALRVPTNTSRESGIVGTLSISIYSILLAVFEAHGSVTI
jgi:hypothetical protein